MCRTLPGRIIQIQGGMAEIEQDGEHRWCNALAQPDAQPGNYVLTHAHLIVALISEEEATQMIQAARELDILLLELDRTRSQ